jgi:hypothetical protein
MTVNTFPGSGGWRSRTYRDGTRLAPDIPILASEKYTVKRTGATFKAQTPSTGVNEVQTISSSGATGGTFTLSFNGPSNAGIGLLTSTSDPLPFGATAAQVQAALQGLSGIGVGNVTVTGGPANSGALVVTFTGQLAKSNVPFLIQVSGAGLTGGTAPTVTETTKGTPANVVEIPRGQFVLPDLANPGYYKPYANGDTINDAVNGISGYLMESINVAFGDVTEGLLISGSVLKARVTPTPVPAAIVTAITGRITLQ